MKPRRKPEQTKGLPQPLKKKKKKIGWFMCILIGICAHQFNNWKLSDLDVEVDEIINKPVELVESVIDPEPAQEVAELAQLEKLKPELLKSEESETTVKNPKLSPIIPVGFQGTWTLNATGLHPAGGEEPWVLAAKTFRAHETYADVRFVIIHGSDAITLVLDVSSEGEEFTEEKYLKLAQNGNRLEMKRTEGAESGFFLYRASSLTKDKLGGEEKNTQSWEDEELTKLKDDSDVVETPETQPKPVAPSVVDERAWGEYKSEVAKQVKDVGLFGWYPALSEATDHLRPIAAEFMKHECIALLSTSEEAYELRRSLQLKHKVSEDFCLYKKSHLNAHQILQDRVIRTVKNTRFGPHNPHESVEEIRGVWERDGDKIRENYGLQKTQFYWDLAVVEGQLKRDGDGSYSYHVYIPTFTKLGDDFGATPEEAKGMTEMFGLKGRPRVGSLLIEYKKLTAAPTIAIYQRVMGSLGGGRDNITPFELFNEVVDTYHK